MKPLGSNLALYYHFHVLEPTTMLVSVFYYSHLGSDASGLENPASLADTQAAKQSLSSSVMVSI